MRTFYRIVKNGRYLRLDWSAQEFRRDWTDEPRLAVLWDDKQKADWVATALNAQVEEAQ